MKFFTLNFARPDHEREFLRHRVYNFLHPLILSFGLLSMFFLYVMIQNFFKTELTKGILAGVNTILFAFGAFFFFKWKKQQPSVFLLFFNIFLLFLEYGYIPWSQDRPIFESNQSPAQLFFIGASFTLLHYVILDPPIWIVAFANIIIIFIFYLIELTAFQKVSQSVFQVLYLVCGGLHLQKKYSISKLERENYLESKYTAEHKGILAHFIDFIEPNPIFILSAPINKKSKENLKEDEMKSKEEGLEIQMVQQNTSAKTFFSSLEKEDSGSLMNSFKKSIDSIGNNQEQRERMLISPYARSKTKKADQKTDTIKENCKEDEIENTIQMQKIEIATDNKDEHENKIKTSESNFAMMMRQKEKSQTQIASPSPLLRNSVKAAEETMTIQNVEFLEFAKHIEIKLSSFSNLEVNEQPLSLNDFINNLFNDLSSTSPQPSGSKSAKTVFGKLKVVGKGTFYYEIRISEFYWQESISLFLIFTDISQKVRNQKLLEMDKYKDQVLATVSHDLRTPLNMIINSQKMLIDSRYNDEEFIKCIEMGKSNSNLLLYLVNDILDQGRIREGKMAMDFEWFDLTQVKFELILNQKAIKDTLEIICPQAKDKNLELKTIIDPNLPQSIQSDSKRLRQVLINLLSNAIKFTDKGEINIIAELRMNLIKIGVKDTGIGIPKNIIQQLFKPYSTFNDNQNRNKQGIGLGLIICKNIVAFLGPQKKIFLESEVNKGSYFYFYIQSNNSDNNWASSPELKQVMPLTTPPKPKNMLFASNTLSNIPNIFKFEGKKTPEAPSFMVRQMTFANAKKPVDKPKEKPDKIDHSSEESLSIPDEKEYQSDKFILVVDDNAFNIQVIEMLFAKIKTESQKIIRAYNGKDALDKLAENNWNLRLVLMDFDMPIMDGIEATKKIREHCRIHSLKEMPIIGLSATNDESEINTAIDAGMNEVLLKPVDEKRLRQCLSKWIIQESSPKWRENTPNT